MSPMWIVFALLPVLGLGERFSCRGRILGGYYADVKSGCRAFHVCVRVAGGGVRDFRFFCPPGTLFQQEAQTCTDWGDDDGLACPADLYDGQFDLYKIGSGLGFDTKKTTNNQQREEESEFSLQRAETGDRRLSANSAHSTPSSQPQNQQSDLRAAHSSDFFSGRRDRGREEPSPSSVAPPTASPTAPPVPSVTRQSYRRPPQRSSPRPTSFDPPSSPSSTILPYEPHPKRKLIRKRPVNVHISSTAAPTTFKDFSTSSPKQSFRNYEPSQPDYGNTRSSVVTQTPRTYSEDFVDVIKVSPKVGRYEAPNFEKKKYEKSGMTEIYNYQSTPKIHIKTGLTELYNYNAQSTPKYNTNENNNNKNSNENTNFFNNQNHNYNQQTNFKNENNYITNQDNYPNNQNNQNNNFNHNSRSEKHAYQATVRNNFNVESPPEVDYNINDVRKNVEVSPNGIRGSTNNFNDKSTRNIGNTTPAYRNFNSVSYDSEKKINNHKQNFVSQTTPDYSTTRNVAPLNLNTVAYKTNVGFDARNINYAESDEDDGQYRLPSGEDDGQYRPELYERESELLSGAHSLNIAASGNRLPDDQKPRRPATPSQTAAPRPFSSAPFSTQPPRTTEITYSSSPVYQTTKVQQPLQTKQTYNYYTTVKSDYPTTLGYSNSVYTTTTTTRRPTTVGNTQSTTYYPPAPSSIAPQPFVNQNQEQPRIEQPRHEQPSHEQPRYEQPRHEQPRHEQPTHDQPRPEPPRPQKNAKPQQPAFSKPVTNNKEDTSYDYAYYDSDPGLTEYDHIEEFGKTKAKV